MDPGDTLTSFSVGFFCMFWHLKRLLWGRDNFQAEGQRALR